MTFSARADNKPLPRRGKAVAYPAGGVNIYPVSFTLGVLFVCFLVPLCRAENIKLKNGHTVSGEIVEESPQVVKVLLYGVTVPYFREEILEIDRKAVSQEGMDTACNDIKGPRDLHLAVCSARRHIKNREFKAAFMDLETVRLKYHDNPDLNAALGSVCYAEKRYREAVICFEKAAFSVKSNPAYLRNLGKAYFMAGDMRPAEKVFRQLISSDKENNAETFLFMGRILLKNEDFKEALVYLEKSLQIDRTNPLTLHCSGWGHYCRKEYREAVSFWEQAIDAGYPSSATYYNIGDAYLHLDVLDKAQYYFENALKSQYIDKGLVYGKMGQVSLRKKDLRQAAVYFKRAVECGNKDAQESLNALEAK